MRIDLTEAGPAQHLRLDDDLARRLAASGVVDVRPSPTPGLWRIRAGRQVGAARFGPVDVYITPKVPVANLVFLLGYARNPRGWQADSVRLDTAAGLVPAFAGALWRQTNAAIRSGLLQGYRTINETGPVLRGRIRETDQLGRWLGAPTPLETRHDDYTVDIPENRILAAATDRMLRLPGVPEADRRMLRHLTAVLAEVTPIHRGQPRLAWTPTRLNARYHAALHLAELVLDATSITGAPGVCLTNGLLIDMPRIFEDFLTVVVRETIERRYGGKVLGQRRALLDHGGLIPVVPDISWRHNDVVNAVIDAKYKVDTPAADVYQMLAYCTAYRLPRGHLVYVGDHQPPGRYRIRNSTVEINMHRVDLDQPPVALLQEIDRLVDRIVG